jgi:uncharacterized protein (TIRG00374 family)
MTSQLLPAPDQPRPPVGLDPLERLLGSAAAPARVATSRVTSVPSVLARAGGLGRLLLVAVAGAVLALVASQWSLLARAAAVLAHIDWRWVPAVLLAELASKVAVTAVHRRLLRAGGTTLTTRALLPVTYAGNAVSMTVPIVGAELAAAFTFRQLVRRGASPAAASWTLLVSGVAATSAFALLAAVGSAGTGTWWGVLAAAGGALLVGAPAWAVMTVLRRPRPRQRLLSVVSGLLLRLPSSRRRPGNAVGSALSALLDQLGGLRLPARDGARVLLLASANWLFDCLCLAAAIRAVGAPVPWHGLLLAYLAVAGASSFAVTPGGLGTVEIALTGVLVAAGLDAQHALAAALAYRFVTLWLATAGGWVTYAVLSRRSHCALITKLDERGPAG